MPGDYDIVKKGRAQVRKKQTKEEQAEKALSRAKNKLGGDKAEKLQTEFSKSRDKKEQDGIIRSMLSQGLSQSEVRSMLDIGGHRVQRISKIVEGGEEEGGEEEVRAPPKHACTDDDKEAVRMSVYVFDIEPGYPCAHGKLTEYYHDPTIEWKDVYMKYVEDRMRSMKRVLSFVRWREYVQYYHPRFYMHHMKTDMCNACYHIDTSLAATDLLDERHAELLVQKETHLGNMIPLNCSLNNSSIIEVWLFKTNIYNRPINMIKFVL